MADEAAMQGSVLRLERSSIHDGQGLRTVVFLKGCPLRCQWCSTPESQQPQCEKGYARDRCTGCGACVRACPSGALSMDGVKVRTDSTKCTYCFTCVKKCPSRAQKGYGSNMSVQDVMREIAKDEIFFFHSGGGVTISGGEPLIQYGFVRQVLRQCKEHGIHTAMETSLSGPFESLEQVAPWLDVLFVDLKHMDPKQHEHWAGQDNTRILANIRRIDQERHPLEIIARIPMVPGVNDSDANLAAAAAFCRSLRRLKELELLPYHRLGSDTYRHLGLPYRLNDVTVPSQERILERGAFLAAHSPGVPVRVGGGLVGQIS